MRERRVSHFGSCDGQLEMRQNDGDKRGQRWSALSKRNHDAGERNANEAGVREGCRPNMHAERDK